MPGARVSFAGINPPHTHIHIHPNAHTINLYHSSRVGANRTLAQARVSPHSFIPRLYLTRFACSSEPAYSVYSHIDNAIKFPRSGGGNHFEGEGRVETFIMASCEAGFLVPRSITCPGGVQKTMGRSPKSWLSHPAGGSGADSLGS